MKCLQIRLIHPKTACLLFFLIGCSGLTLTKTNQETNITSNNTNNSSPQIIAQIQRNSSTTFENIVAQIKLTSHNYETLKLIKHRNKTEIHQDQVNSIYSLDELDAINFRNLIESLKIGDKVNNKTANYSTSTINPTQNIDDLNFTTPSTPASHLKKVNCSISSSLNNSDCEALIQIFQKLLDPKIHNDLQSSFASAMVMEPNLSQILLQAVILNLKGLIKPPSEERAFNSYQIIDLAWKPALLAQFFEPKDYPENHFSQPKDYPENRRYLDTRRKLNTTNEVPYC